MSDTPFDGIQLRVNADTPSDWPPERPRLSCRKDNQLSLEAVKVLATELEVNGTVTAKSFSGEFPGLTEKVSKAGDTMTGSLTIEKDLSVGGTVTASKGFIGDGSKLTGIPSSSDKVSKAGDIMTGSLTIQKDLSVSGTVTASKGFIGDGSKLTNISGTSPWSVNATNPGISYSNGNVGIGTETSTPQAKLQVANGAIMPSAGNSETAGIMFPKDAFGGSGDAAWIRYYARTGKATTLEIGTSNDGDDHIALIASGNVGIGTINPQDKLDVAGNLRILTDSNPIRFTSAWSSFPDSKPNQAEISNDTTGYKTLMIIGNKSAGGVRRVSVWDKLEVNGDLSVTGNVGIGTTNPSTTLHVQGSKAGSETLVENHIAVIENTKSDKEADVLALKVGIEDTTQNENNFITFFATRNQEVIPIGAIQGQRYLRKEDNKYVLGVALSTTTADYAECIPRLLEDEVIEAGDIVGVVGGKVTKVTQDVHHVMVITDRPIVLGNAPEKSEKHLYEKVGFLGQVPIKVRGKVSAGDCIIPSGLNDGTGVALPRHEMSLATCAQIVGTAWESSEEEGVKRVNAAIGLNSSYSPVEALMRAMQTQQAEIDFLKTELKQLREQQKEQQFLKA